MTTEAVTIDDASDRALLVRYDETELLETLGVRLYADHDMTGGKMSANRTLLAAGTDGPPPHYHTTSAELFYMLDGRLRVLAGEEVVTIGSGDFLLIPPNTTHAWAAPADASADVLIVFTPGIERFEYFRLVDRIRQGKASPEEVLDTMERFDNHFVDSPLWR
ncbi:cupin domain-containing protein [Nocardia bovistercoris]|uniref:Cupin domain-containing protein n=1 Tax=Nocardia bovistercoris TaxID=2785916 RepID=A0A931IFI0_9NOCA|nr:cupin domain-containing protein [Nocardia bovistercoris]MBH0780494.1 cupin domain-containing protein [Nocardia bovistercoris]